MKNLAFPFHFNNSGQTANCDEARHIRDMIEQFLFTNPGERLNRPQFGSGLLYQVFALNSQENAASLQFTLQAGLEQWLGDIIEIQVLQVTPEDAVLRVDLRYLHRRTQEQRVERFERSML